MKKQTFAVGTALLFCLVLAVASAHSQGRGVVANVPFAFSVGDKALPAGQYSIMPALSSGPFVQEIRSADGNAAIFLPTMALDARDAKDGHLGPRLVFHVYGHSYFLSEIWTDAGVQGRKLLETSREKELARSETKREVAVLLQPLYVKR
jgi:hypothetical protein